MLSKDEARDLLNFKYPGIRVESGIDLETEWVFRAFLPIGGGEENMNPFLSVDKMTGDVNDFSPAAYLEPMQLVRLFAIEDAQAKPATPQEVLAQRKQTDT